MRVPELVVSNPATEAAHRGHPWIYRDAVIRGGRVPTGAEVQIVSTDGEAVGRGLYDDTSPLAVRLWTRGRAPLDAALVESRFRRAFALRRELFASGTTTAYRLLHGEGDRMPGLVIDRYGTVAVVRADGDAIKTRLPGWTAVLVAALRAEGIETVALREAEKGQAPRFEVLAGGPLPAVVDVREHGIPFVVDLARGQKTGAFLDQRENRRRVGELAHGRRVLNLFSYAGGFSLAAAKGGAAHVTSVDIAAGGHATAQESFRRAGVDPKAHAFVTADAFVFLESAVKAKKTWDLVVSDPPSFAPSEKAKKRAVSAYRSLHRACAAVLADGGIFCAASCSSHVDDELFASTLDDGALGRSDLRLLERFGPPPDHPTLPSWPEGRYLKFYVLA